MIAAAWGPHTCAKSRFLAVRGQNRARRRLSAGGNRIRTIASREAPRPTIVVSRDDLCLMTPSSLSVRHLSSATAERPFTRAGPLGYGKCPTYFDPRRNRNTSRTGTRLNGRTGSSSPRNRPRRLAAGSLHKQEMNGKPGRCVLPKILLKGCCCPDRAHAGEDALPRARGGS